MSSIFEQEVSLPTDSVEVNIKANYVNVAMLTLMIYDCSKAEFVLLFLFANAQLVASLENEV